MLSFRKHRPLKKWTFPLIVITIRSSRTYAMAPNSWHWLQSRTSLIKRLPVAWVSHDLTARWIFPPLAVARKWCTLTDAAVGWHSFMFSEMTVRRVEIPPRLRSTWMPVQSLTEPAGGLDLRAHADTVNIQMQHLFLQPFFTGGTHVPTCICLCHTCKTWSVWDTFSDCTGNLRTGNVLISQECFSKLRKCIMTHHGTLCNTDILVKAVCHLPSVVYNGVHPLTLLWRARYHQRCRAC